MHKQQAEVIPPPDKKSPLGETPAKLAKRDLVKPSQWCPVSKNTEVLIGTYQ